MSAGAVAATLAGVALAAFAVLATEPDPLPAPDPAPVAVVEDAPAFGMVTWEDGSWAYTARSVADLPTMADGEWACLGEPGEPYAECAEWSEDDGWINERPY